MTKYVFITEKSIFNSGAVQVIPNSTDRIHQRILLTTIETDINSTKINPKKPHPLFRDFMLTSLAKKIKNNCIYITEE
jgi:hypothetical protein